MESKTVSVNDPIVKYTLPYLNEYKKQLPANLEQFCRELVPIYSYDRQARAVRIEQGTTEWHLLRSNLITGSNFGSAVGNNRYKKPDELLQNMIWPQTESINAYGQRAMAWGTSNESHVRDYYVAYIRQLTFDHKRQWFDLTSEFKLPEVVAQHIRELVPMTTLEKLINEVYVHMKSYQHNDIEIFQVGFCISEQYPWCGGSPDGLICRYDSLLQRFILVGLLEIKCPFRGQFYPEIPPYYRDQIQGFMNLFDIPWCHFVTWISPGQMRIDHHPRDVHYWNTELFPKLERFYFHRYLPRKVLQHFKLLQTNTISPVVQWDNEDEND